mmetsp:Transcript_81719/g.212548  ORF Transcript_81719/g.212548 Transcript_81719/m.212548 type:complete len:203 (-) Transcript_81719:365-973(-)
MTAAQARTREPRDVVRRYAEHEATVVHVVPIPALDQLHRIEDVRLRHADDPARAQKCPDVFLFQNFGHGGLVNPFHGLRQDFVGQLTEHNTIPQPSDERLCPACLSGDFLDPACNLELHALLIPPELTELRRHQGGGVAPSRNSALLWSHLDSFLTLALLLLHLPETNEADRHDDDQQKQWQQKEQPTQNGRKGSANWRLGA